MNKISDVQSRNSLDLKFTKLKAIQGEFKK